MMQRALQRVARPRAAVAASLVARPAAQRAARHLSLLAVTRPRQRPALGRFARLFSVEEIPVPSMGDSITEGTVVEWTANVGDGVKMDDVVVVIETDKVSIEVRTPVGGAITEHLAEIDAVVEVGQPLFKVDTAAEGAVKAVAAPEPVAEAPVAAAPAAAAPSNPWPVGSKVDKGAAAPAPAPPPAPAAPAPPVVPGARTETRVKMNRMRLRIAERLKEAQNTAACLTTFQECDMGDLMELRKTHKEEFEKVHGVKLGFMSAFVKAATAALLETPAVNAYIDDVAKEIVYRDYCDVSVAVASPAGLVVPVLRNTEQMSFADVEKSIGMYAAKARAGELSLEEMSGGTFTISNGGVFGSLMGTPILNPPQSAILGMHATKMRAVVKDGVVQARPMMYLALTYDHRMIDGREAVTFLKSVATKIEDPGRFLLGL